MFVIHAVRAPTLLRPAAALGALRRFSAWCALCYARHEQRKHLAELDERMLKDVGIAPADAAEEMRKPFWRR